MVEAVVGEQGVTAGARLFRLLEELGAPGGLEEVAPKAVAAAMRAARSSGAALLLGEGAALSTWTAAEGQAIGRSCGVLPVEAARSLLPGATRLTLQAGEEPLGELLLLSGRRADDELLVTIAAACALALSKAQSAGRELQTRHQLELLLRAGALPGGSPSPAPLQELVALFVPHLCDFATLDLVEGEGLVRSAAAHRDEGKTWLLHQLGRGRQRDLASAAPPQLLAARTGRPALFPALPEPALVAMAADEQEEALLRELAPTSLLSVPVLAGSEATAVLSLGMASSGRTLTARDLPLAEELARRAAALLGQSSLLAEKRRAEERLEARDEFLSIASHELKTPLTALQLAVQSAQRGVQQLGDSAARAGAAARLATAERQVKRLTGLVDQLLDLSRIRLGRLELQPSEIDLCALIPELLDRWHEQLAAAHCPLTVLMPRELRGRWDAGRLEQVVSNLIANAIKYGGGKPVQVELAAHGATALVAVRDQGIGIAPEDHERIFERFERAAPSRHYAGFGLGLWIARELAQAMGGRIRVESAPGQGSRFVVELPLSPPARAAA